MEREEEEEEEEGWGGAVLLSGKSDFKLFKCSHVQNSLITILTPRRCTYSGSTFRTSPRLRRHNPTHLHLFPIKLKRPFLQAPSQNFSQAVELGGCVHTWTDSLYSENDDSSQFIFHASPGSLCVHRAVLWCRPGRASLVDLLKPPLLQMFHRVGHRHDARNNNNNDKEIWVSLVQQGVKCNTGV